MDNKTKILVGLAAFLVFASLAGSYYSFRWEWLLRVWPLETAEARTPPQLANSPSSAHSP